MFSEFVVVAIAAVLVIASVTGQGKELCDAMGGKYSPETAQTEACPGGSWLNLLPRAHG